VAQPRFTAFCNLRHTFSARNPTGVENVMAYVRTAAWLADKAKRLRAAAGGNVTIAFALGVVPIFGFVGAAVDYGRANSVKAAMQVATDSTALLLSKFAQDLTEEQIQAKANEYFVALFTRPEAANIEITQNFTSPQPGSFKLQLAVSAVVETTFTKVVGQPKLNVNVNSEVLWGIRKLEVALALDNTGSMSSNSKMTHLKAAAHNLLTTLKNAAKTDGDVKIAIVPFDTTVNIGTSYKDNDWFDYDSLDCNGSKSGKGCNSSNWKEHWEGCVRDRTYPFDIQDDPPTGVNTNTYFPVHDCGSLAKMMPLTYDWTALNNRIDEMTPNGNTNVTIGLAWAWHALTSQAPLSEAVAPSPDLDKVIILLTDGDNTESWKNSSNTKVTNQSTIDGRTALVCSNIKAAAIRIYTVRVVNGDATLLRNCATNPTMYYDVQQASQLNNAFSSIAQNLANLRIVK
jgi:Flp pilus assembly protein TadG